MDSVSVEKILNLLHEWRLPLDVESSAQIIVPLLSKLVIADDVILATSAATVLERPAVNTAQIARLIFDAYISVDTPRRARLLKPLAQSAGDEALPFMRQALEKYPEDFKQILRALGYVGATSTLDRVELLWALAQARRQQLANDEQLSTDTAFLDIQRQLENIECSDVLPPDVRDLARKYADEIDAWLKASSDATDA